MVKTDPTTVSEILERGVVDVIVRQDLQRKLASGKQLKVKLGIDPTGSDLTIGHAVVLRKLKQFSQAGHHVDLVIGTFTGRIGDPTGKSQTRGVLDMDQIRKNIATWMDQAAKVLDVDKVKVVYNHEWLEKLNFADVTNLAMQFTVQQMLQRDMYQERWKKELPIALHEFMYPLMQGYDSVALKSDVELGGTDQLFNLLAGRPIQKAYGLSEQNILTVPILEGLDGKEKMSKSLGNYIALNDSAADMYGKTMSIPDALIGKYFELATEVPMETIKGYLKMMQQGENPRNIKMKLAFELSALYHGETAAHGAQDDFVKMFQKDELPENVPDVTVDAARWKLLDLVEELKLAPSRSDARRMIDGGGVKIDNVKASNQFAEVDVTTPVILQVGRKKVVRVSLKK